MMRSRTLLLAALLFAVVVSIRPQGSLLAMVLCGSWLAVGVGHGLFDAFLAASVWKISLQKVLLGYAFLTAFVAGCTLLAPEIVLALHVVASAYHFGQSEWGEPGSGKSRERALVFVWGGSIVGAMVLGPWSESRIVLESLLGASFNGLDSFVASRRDALIAAFCCIGIVSAACLARATSKLQEPEGLLGRLLETLLLQALFLALPLYVSFVLYLSLWHGLRSFLQDVSPVLSEFPRTKLVKVIALTAVVTLAILAAIILGVPNRTALPWFVSPAAFAFLVAVTLPHTAVLGAVAMRKVGVRRGASLLDDTRKSSVSS